MCRKYCYAAILHYSESHKYVLMPKLLLHTVKSLTCQQTAGLRKISYNLQLSAGEWGGRFENGSQEQTWLEAFLAYLLNIGATDHFFWCLNPNSGKPRLKLLLHYMLS